MLALAYITVEGADPVEEIAAAAAAGFDAVGLRVTAPKGRPATSSSWQTPSYVAEVARELRDSGVSLLDVEVLTIDEAFDLTAAERLVDTAAALGASFLQVVCEDTQLDRAADRLAGVADLCRHSSVSAALEFMAFRSVGCLATARRLAAHAGGVPILIDALHLVRSGGTPADLAEMPSSAIAFFQLCDAPARPRYDLIREARFDRLYPGEGELPLGEMLASLPASVPISVEVPRASMAERPPRERAHEAMAWTRRFLAGER